MVLIRHVISQEHVIKGYVTLLVGASQENSPSCHILVIVGPVLVEI